MADEKRDAVLEAAADVFSRYGFRRTSMNDVAEAAGISRPALYLMFDNKEDMFRQLVSYRQAQAIDAAADVLSGDGPAADRVKRAVLAYERVFYEPVAGSPHGAEFMDLNQGVASEDLARGRERLVGHLADCLDDALARGEIRFPDSAMSPSDFAHLLMFSITGMKKAASSIEDFRQKIRDVCAIFMASVTQRLDS